MPRIIGRKIYPSTLAERRVLLGFGVDCLRVPRTTNPFIVARRLRRAAHTSPDLLMLSDVVAKSRRAFAQPAPTPECAEPTPHHSDELGDADDRSAA